MDTLNGFPHANIDAVGGLEIVANATEQWDIGEKSQPGALPRVAPNSNLIGIYLSHFFKATLST